MPAAPIGRGALGLYRLASAAAAPLVRRHLERRCAAGREDPARLHERLGRPVVPRPSGPLVWIHGASVGEALSALPLIERLRARWPDLALLVTTGTVTSARLMAERLPPGVIHQYAPVDLPAAVRGFLDHWRPSVALMIESELWPNLLDQARARGVRLILLNARLSAASYGRWRRAGPVIAHLLAGFELILAQSPEDARRLRALSAARVELRGNLKFAAAPLSADPAELEALRAAGAGRPRWLAASTHPGEEEIVAAAHARIAQRAPGLLTILAPRHPHRGAELAGRLRAQGHAVARRSAGEPLEPGTAFYIADTIGEMGLWYRLAEVVLVGGSLVPKGGQNLLEPARIGCAILCGPHMGNFQRVAEEMQSAGAVRQVADATQLGAEVETLLQDAGARAAMIEAAARYAAAQAGVLDDIVEALAPQLDRAAAATV